MSNRNISIHLFVSDNEYNMIKAKMSNLGTDNMAGYIRKMAIDGVIVKLDIPELKEICSLLRYNGNNINQIAKRLNEGRQVYYEDIKDIKEKQKLLCDMVNTINMKLSKI